MSDPAVVVELIPAGLVWSILRRFASATPGAGSQLGEMGTGKASSAALNCAATVAQKLERCPIVARVLWLDVAADLVRNVIRPHESRRSVRWELVGERPEVIDTLFEFGAGLVRERSSDRRMQTEARRIERSTAYREQFALMVVELSACWEDDPAFRRWAETRDNT